MTVIMSHASAIDDHIAENRIYKSAPTGHSENKNVMYLRLSESGVKDALQETINGTEA